MNANKAREFFSSYFEGNLDDGLRQAFERTLNTDAELQAEYKAFERTLGQLAGLRDVEIEVPFDLHERISARLDRHIYEKRQTRGGGFLAFWKPALAAGVASLAVIGTVLSLNSSGGDVQGAAVIGGGPKFQHAGRIPLYPITELDSWAESLLSPLKSSTSEKAE